MAQLLHVPLPLSGSFRAQALEQTPCKVRFNPDLWPLDGTFDPVAITGSCAQTLLKSIPLAANSNIKVFNVRNGLGNTCEDVDPARHLGCGSCGGCRNPADSSLIPELSVILVDHDLSRRTPMSLTAEGLVSLFDQYMIPAEFIEILVNNNGALTSRSHQTTGDGIPERLDLFIKCPTSKFLNSAIYFSCDLKTSKTTVVVFGTYLAEISTRLQEVFPGYRKEGALPIKDPFIVLSTIVAEYSGMMEYERRELDFSVRQHESKTGASAHLYDESFRAQTKEYADLNQTLHVTEGYVTFFQRTLSFQIDLIQFLREQHMKFKAFQATTNLKVVRISDVPITKQDYQLAQAASKEEAIRVTLLEMRNMLEKIQVQSSTTETLDPACRADEVFRKSLTLTRNRLEQVNGLQKRVQVQLSVVQNLISQNDSRINLLLARQSALVAIATRNDSVAMKTIAGITMFFLPGTFVATFFSMVFFKTDTINGHQQFSVNSYWWLYLAVTVSLTILVGIAWYSWLRVSRKNKRESDVEGWTLPEKERR